MRKIEPTKRPIPCGDGFLCHDPHWCGSVELNDLGWELLTPRICDYCEADTTGDQTMIHLAKENPYELSGKSGELGGNA